MTIDTSTATLIISALIQSGLVGWIIRREYKVTALGEDVAKLKTSNEELSRKVLQVEKDVLVHNTVVEEIRSRMGKLDQIDKLVTTMEFIRERLDSFVPRAEFEARMAAMEKH